MPLRHVVLWVSLILPVVLGNLPRPPRITAKNVHKSHITHHSLNTEEEERRNQAEHGWHPTEDACAKALNVSKVCVARPSSFPLNSGTPHPRRKHNLMYAGGADVLDQRLHTTS